MTYYAFMLLGVLFIGEIFIHAKAKTWKEFGKATGIFILSLLLVLGTKLTWFQMNRSYLKETMRGGHSELVSDNAVDDGQDKLVGLDFDYATAWSYGKTETFTLLVPEYMGGASGYDLGKNSKLEKELKSGVNMEFKDEEYIYLLNVSEFVARGDIEPLDHASSRIRGLLINSNEVTYMRKIKEDLYDAALEKNRIIFHQKNRQ